MDPVGPWSAYASYNRLAGVQAGSTGGDFHHHLAGSGSGLAGHSGAPGVPSTTSQLLLQAAHTTASLAGQLGSSGASPFNPGGFLSPPPVGYDAVFSPLFHHANPKPAHYSSTINAQHRQALAQAQAAAASKQSSVESELSTLRENYTTHHQSLAAAQGGTFFDQSSAPTSAAGLAWQGNNQLPSPFGILPHESVVPSSPSPATTKASSAAYENFNAHYAAAQTLNNHLSSQLVANANKAARSASPQVTPPVKPVASAAGAFFQTPTTFGSPAESISSYSSTNAKSGQISSQQDYVGSKSFSSTGSSSSSHLTQQSCIVSTTPSSSPGGGKEYRQPPPSRAPPVAPAYVPRSDKSRPPIFVPPPSKPTPPQQIQTKAQTKIYPELGSVNTEQRRSADSSRENAQSQSSPISYSIMDAPGRLNYNGSNSSSKSSRNTSSSQYAVNQQNATYRHYQPGNNTEPEYNPRSKNSESNYSNSAQNGPDCSVVVPRRPSPLQAHSQASPLGHVPSPAYPMYNSPMNSIASPQQHSESPQNQISYNKSSNQVAPRSPLDVSTPDRRPAPQAAQVAYPSVITRALGIDQSSKAYNESRFERSQAPSVAQSQAQACWDNDRQLNQSSRKYSTPTPSNNNYNNSSNNTLESSSRSDKITVQSQVSTQRSSSSSSSEKQVFFDSNQVSLQDLSSCRGDPMSIVKNLQSLQQQSCQVQQEQSKQSARDSPEPAPAAVLSSTKNTGRRKSSEKASSHSNMNELAMAEYFTSRIPPPAHSSTTSQQQQNGTYFDFERWNLPPPPSKMFPGSAPFAAQAALHANNFPNQHQGLMVPHHASLSYFPPFHLAPHPSEYQSSVELAPLTSYDSNPTTPSSSYSTPETRDGEQPKVVVPNIEEELGFLAEQRANSQAPAAPSTPQAHPPQDGAPKLLSDKKLASGAGSGFMASYLKFLQGERDTSPPPATRGGRKANWSRSSASNNKPFNAQNEPAPKPNANEQQNPHANGAAGVLSPTGASNPPVATTPSAVVSPALSKEEDSRYYPANKERKRKFEGDDGFDVNEEEARRLNKPVLNVPSTPLNEKGKKGRGGAGSNKGAAAVAAKKRPAGVAVQAPLPAMQAQPQQYYYQQPDEGAFNFLDLHFRNRQRW